MRRLRPETAWSDGEYMLRSIEYSSALNLWSKSEDAGKGRNKPEPILSPAERERAAEEEKIKAERERAAKERLKRIYNIGGGEDGQ